MQSPFEVVVSSQNTHYMAWQTQLFCFSASSRLGVYPIVVVHEVDVPLRPEFCILRDRGFRILEAPSFVTNPDGVQYQPRNEPGSLLTVCGKVELNSQCILFCEPDMLFVRRPEYAGVLTAEFYPYLHYEKEHIQAVARRVGCGHMVESLNQNARIGVPYLIPVRDAERIGTQWLAVLDAFESLEWVDVMYAFGLALALEGLSAQITRITDSNYQQLQPQTGHLIHYAYGDSLWNKRSYFDLVTPFSAADESLPTVDPGTILGEIVSQIRQARRFFGPQQGS